jgi:DNA-binding NarL/FixJ family response regulator
MSGIECTARLRVAMPQVRILMVTVYDDNDRIFKALQAGASGYLLKRSSGEQLLHAITEVMEGGGPMSGEIARRVIQSFQRPTPAVEPDVELTVREREVLDWVARGFATKEIADRLGISPRTVSLHLQHIYGKLHVRSRTEAALKYRATGGVAAAARSI